jgi:hypothetical protein
VLLIFAPFAFAQPWTGAAGAGVPDESAAGIYDATVGSVGYNASGSTASIVLRYVLTDTSATGVPSWTTIAVDGWDPNPGSLIRARLYRLAPSGTNTMMTSCSTNDSAGFTTTTCPLLGSVNFNTGDTYTIEVTITRTTSTDAPRFRSVRLY